MPERGSVLLTGNLSSLLSKVEVISEPETKEGYYELYIPEGANTLEVSLPSAIIFTPDFEDDDWLPEYALENNLKPVYEVTLMQSVIRAAKEDKPNATISDLVTALNYFQTHDAYIDLKGDS